MCRYQEEFIENTPVVLHLLFWKQKAIIDPSQNDSAQVMVIRQYGEAWDRPFILAFEPSKRRHPSNPLKTLHK